MTEAEALIRRYYDAFNAGDRAGMLALLDGNVIHDVSQGGRVRGRDAFAQFLAHMNRCYREKLDDIVVMIDASGQRAAAEFIVNGNYLETDPDVAKGASPARNQGYRLPAGAFFELRDGRITRVSTHYNLRDWLDQIT